MYFVDFFLNWTLVIYNIIKYSPIMFTYPVRHHLCDASPMIIEFNHILYNFECCNFEANVMDNQVYEYN